jgi:hypothetical protein
MDIEKYNKMKAIADQIRAMREARFRKLATEAGLDPKIAHIHVHNALVSLHYGHPWPGIDYSKVKAARRVEDTIFEPYRILERWDSRVRSSVR